MMERDIYLASACVAQIQGPQITKDLTKERQRDQHRLNQNNTCRLHDR